MFLSLELDTQDLCNGKVSLFKICRSQHVSQSFCNIILNLQESAFNIEAFSLVFLLVCFVRICHAQPPFTGLIGYCDKHEKGPNSHKIK